MGLESYGTNDEGMCRILDTSGTRCAVTNRQTGPVLNYVVCCASQSIVALIPTKGNTIINETKPTHDIEH